MEQYTLEQLNALEKEIKARKESLVKQSNSITMTQEQLAQILTAVKGNKTQTTTKEDKVVDFNSAISSISTDSNDNDVSKAIAKIFNK